MNVLMDNIAKNLSDHLAYVGSAIGVLFFTFVNNMPAKPPATMTEYWTWVRDSLQTAIPMRQTRVNPTQPPPAAQPPKE